MWRGEGAAISQEGCCASELLCNRVFMRELHLFSTCFACGLTEHSENQDATITTLVVNNTYIPHNPRLTLLPHERTEPSKSL